MAFTPVPEVLDGQSAPSADWWNRYIRDNMAVMFPEAATAKGDILAATGVDACAVVSVGANDAHLWADSGAAAGVSWSLPGRARVGYAAVYTAPSKDDGWYKIDATATEAYDTAGALASSRYTATHAGYYMVRYFSVASQNFANYDRSDVDDRLYIGIYKNGELYSVIDGWVSQVDYGTGIAGMAFCGGDIVPLAYGDYIEMYLYVGLGLYVGNDGTKINDSPRTAAAHHWIVQILP